MRRTIKVGADDELIDLEVIVPIKQFGTDADNARKNDISEILRTALPALGLGFWTGDSIGSGSFEIGVQVNDAARAKIAILDILRMHGLSDGATIEDI